MKRGLQSGFSLIEVLITVMILGLSVTALVTGLLAATSGAGMTRELADARTLLAASAEALDAADYAECASITQAGYLAALQSVVRPATSGDTAPDWAQIKNVMVWNGSAFVAPSDSNCAYDERDGAAGASRMQQITLEYQGGPEVLTLIKRGPS